MSKTVSKTKELFYEGMTAAAALNIIREHGMRSRKNPEMVGKNKFGFIIKWTPGSWSLTLARKQHNEIFKVIEVEKVIGIIEKAND